MTGLGALIKRNTKLYFKDKAMFFTSLITPVILLVLYATFLRNVYVDSFRSALDAAGVTVSEALINGCVGGQLVSSLLAVSCVTVAFCSNLLMIQDKVSGARHDLTVAPVKPGALALGYYISTLVSSLTVNLAAAAVSMGYLAFTGWYLSAGDVLLILLDVVLLVLFGTALSSCVSFPLSTNGQGSAVGTVVSAGYGIYADIELFGRTAEGPLLPARHIRNVTAPQPRTARFAGGNERAGLSGRGYRGDTRQYRLQPLLLRQQGRHRCDVCRPVRSDSAFCGTLHSYECPERQKKRR